MIIMCVTGMWKRVRKFWRRSSRDKIFTWLPCRSWYLVVWMNLCQWSDCNTVRLRCKWYISAKTILIWELITCDGTKSIYKWYEVCDVCAWLCGCNTWMTSVDCTCYTVRHVCCKLPRSPCWSQVLSANSWCYGKCPQTTSTSPIGQACKYSN